MSRATGAFSRSVCCIASKSSRGMKKEGATPPFLLDAPVNHSPRPFLIPHWEDNRLSEDTVRFCFSSVQMKMGKYPESVAAHQRLEYLLQSAPTQRKYRTWFQRWLGPLWNRRRARLAAALGAIGVSLTTAWRELTATVIFNHLRRWTIWRLKEAAMNERLVWHDEWALGIEPLDTDHRQAVILLDHLFALEHARPLTARLDDLIAHLRRHFDAEQMFLRSIDYPEWQTHCRDHLLQLAELVELKRELEHSGAIRLSDEDASAIRQWFFAHMLAEDRRFALYYRAKLNRSQPLS